MAFKTVQFFSLQNEKIALNFIFFLWDSKVAKSLQEISIGFLQLFRSEIKDIVIFFYSRSGVLDLSLT